MFNKLMRPFTTWGVPARSVAVPDTITPASPEVQAYGKNPACQAALAQVNALVWDTITVPACNPALAERWRVVHQVNLPFQIQACHRAIRARMAADMGFPQYSETEAIRLLTGLEPKGEPMVSHRLCAAKFADSNCLRAYKADHGKALEPFSWSAIDGHIPHHNWRVAGSSDVLAFGHPNDLRMEMPTGILLRLITAQKFRATLPPPTQVEAVRAPVPSVTATEIRTNEARSQMQAGTASLLAWLREEYMQSALGIRPHMPTRGTPSQPVVGPLFDELVVLAPETCFTVRPERPDPLLLGMIGGAYSSPTKRWMHQYFLLGRWE